MFPLKTLKTPPLMWFFVVLILMVYWAAGELCSFAAFLYGKHLSFKNPHYAIMSEPKEVMSMYFIFKIFPIRFRG
jgi:hypothetical protein